MTSIIKFKTLSGAMDDSPPSYLLSIDEFTFLLDCGWDENFSQNFIKEISKHLRQIDAVLLTYPDNLHLGSLPYLVGKLGLNCPIYATIPVYKMGQMFMYDLHQSRHNYEDFNLFTLDDVDAAFDKIIQLKYNQSVTLKGKGRGLTIIPLPAGHMIGGTIWRILKDGEEDIVYAVDYNHKRERHLNGCILENLSRPSLLITDSYNVLYTQARRKQRDEQLMTTILSTLRKGGNVLIAVDTAGRILELAHMLDQLWRTPDSGLMAYSLALLNTVSYNVIEFAKSQVEWMSDKIMRSFEGHRNNPFAFKHLQLCHVYSDILRVREPRVVLASQPDLECGLSRQLFIDWSKNPRNSIILTQRCSPGTLTNQLMNNTKRLITLEIKERLPLQGLELEEYRKQEKLKLLNKISSTKNESDSDSDENIESGDDEDEDNNEKQDDQMGVNISDISEGNFSLNIGYSGDGADGSKSGVNNLKHDPSKSDGKSKSGHFFKHVKKAYPMFPAVEHKIKWDDYGEIINPEDFMIFDHSGVSSGQDTEDNKENSKDDENTMETNEVPTKCVVNVQTFNVNANIQFIDFEGRSDGESLKKIISMIKPRRIIIVRGSYEATTALADHCQNFGISSNKIFTPKLYEMIDATTESHIYQVKLKDSLVSSLSFSQAKDGAELAWVEAEIDMQAEESLLPKSEANNDVHESDKQISIKTELIENDEKLVNTNERDLVPILRPIPLVSLPNHMSIYVNELKLSDFKQVLMKNEIQAEFSGGVLYCNNNVAVRRNETGRIHLEGTLCEDYFKVRDLLYQQYAVV